MKSFNLLLFMLVLSPAAIGEGVDLNVALKKLDYVVGKRDYYIQKKQQVIDNLKKDLETSMVDNDKYVICKRIYDEYQKFNADSALFYAYSCQKLAMKTKRNDWLIQAEIDRIFIIIYQGKLVAAKSRLIECGPIGDLSPQFMSQYAVAAFEYYMRINISGNIDIADPLSSNNELCWNTYKKYIPSDSWYYDYYEVAETKHQIKNRLIKRLKSLPKPSIPAAMIEVALAKIYKNEGDSKLYYYYLICSAINDICSGNREAQSLLSLIESPYVRKNKKRAFVYAMVCTENAKAYKDRGRSLSIIDAHAIIINAYESALERKAQNMSDFIALLAVFIVIIFIQLLLLIKKHKRQNAMFVKLEEINAALNESISKENEMQLKLKENNDRLQEELKYRNNNFLDVYLLVSRYIADVRKFKKSVYNLLIAGKLTSAKKQLSSTINADEYLQNFYKQFDKAYLSAHPDFVERFNKLMKPDMQIIVPSSGTLTPELRIYALVSLGITDSVSIADFLHYSTQTIYNYRLKIRHSSCIIEKDFADVVAKMYYQ
jgi:hypothetical protein